jgi:hypothetical protein
VFGIQSTGTFDAAPPPPDAPPDAPPPACPATGEVPKFGTDLKMVSARDCMSFAVNEAETSAVALCTRPGEYNYRLSAGTVESGVTPQGMMPEPAYIAAMRFVPEGDAMYVVTYDTNTGANLVYPYAFVDGMWTQTSKTFTPPTDQPGYFTISSPSRGPARRMLATVVDMTYQYYLTELEGSGSDWTEVGNNRVLLSDFMADFGGGTPENMSLSGDGLRLVFTTYSYGFQEGGGYASEASTGSTTWIGNGGTQPVLYADRASLDVPFSKPREIDSVPNQVMFPHLAENCGRIYFSALDTVWYLEQPPLM